MIPTTQKPSTPTVGFNFSSSPPKITSSSTTLKGYRIQQQNNNNNTSSSQQQRTALLVIDTKVWNQVWDAFFTDDESQDKAFDLLQKEGKPTNKRAVLLRLFPSRLAVGGGGSSGVSSTMSQTALSSLQKDVETQARACGPVEFVRIFDGKEFLVQFTCETAARLFQSTCSVEDNQLKPSGFLARVQNEFGVDDPRAVVTPAQRIDLVLALSSSSGNNNNNNRHPKIIPALELRVAAEENNSNSNNNNGSGTNSNNTMSGNNNNLMNFSYGIQLSEKFVKALFSAAGATEVKSVGFEVFGPPSPSSNENNNAPSFKRFFMKFSSFKDAQMALHTLQFPLRRIFGLSLNFTGEYPQHHQEENKTATSPKKKTIVVQGGTNTKFAEDSEEEE